MNTFDNMVAASAKAFFFEVQMPDDGSAAKLAFEFAESDGDNFKIVESEGSSAKVYLVYSDTNTYSEVTVTKSNRNSFIPTGFKGWVIAGIDDYFEFNWGSGNNIVNPEKIETINIVGLDTTDDYYIDNIGFAVSQEAFLDELNATVDNGIRYGQTFEGITDVTTAVPSNSPNVSLSLDNSVLDSQSLKMTPTGYFSANIKLNTFNNAAIANSKAFFFEVQMPDDGSAAKLAFEFAESDGDNFKIIENESSSAKVYLVYSDTNTYTEVTVTKSNRNSFIPAGFKGWVIAGIDDYFEFNWGSGNNIVNPEKIESINIVGFDTTDDYYIDNIGFAASQEAFLEKLGAIDSVELYLAENGISTPESIFVNSTEITIDKYTVKDGVLELNLSLFAGNDIVYVTDAVDTFIFTVVNYKATYISKQSEVIYGDANGNNQVDIVDLVRLKKYLSNITVDIDILASDVNGDKSVNAQDLVELRKYLLEEIEVLGPSITSVRY